MVDTEISRASATSAYFGHSPTIIRAHDCLCQLRAAGGQFPDALQGAAGGVIPEPSTVLIWALDLLGLGVVRMAAEAGCVTA